MPIAQKCLEIARQRGKAGKELKGVYSMLLCEELYLMAYAKLYSNAGALTPGTAPDDTVDGMSLERIRTIIEKLRNGTYNWKPVRRTYKEKPNSKKQRPIGMPCWNDKLLQEVIRKILSAYYEPQFRESSHGFRENKGCHTALTEILRNWTGTRWFIELDIKGCFDNLNWEIMLEIIGRKIKDDRFLKLLKGMLKAGYVEDWIYHKTYSGTPQGGILSPLLANIVLNELDTYVEDELIPEYTKGKVKRTNPEYRKIQQEKQRTKKARKKWIWDKLTREMRRTPCKDPNDPNYKRLRYARYADDSILGLDGHKQDAEHIKEKLKSFLWDRLKLEMSEEKTDITHARTEKARFLNYEITANWDNTKVTLNKKGIKARSINGGIVLIVPEDVSKTWKKKVLGKNNTIRHRPELFNLSDYDIIRTYETELQGLINYYTLAHNVYRSMTTLRYFWFMSLAKTLAGKHRTRKTTILKSKKYTRYTADGRKIIAVEVQRKEKEPLIAVFGRKPIERKLTVKIKDEIAEVHIHRNELITRLLANKCELCGKESEIQGHHIRKLKDLKKRYEGRREKPEWVKKMIAIRRKTLFVCNECHNKIHHGTYDGKKLV